MRWSTMPNPQKDRTDYVFVARRLGPNPQNLGDFSVSRRTPRRTTSERRDYQHYHYNSENGRLINRGALLVISHGSYIYRECVKAVQRLIDEAADA